MPEPPRKWTTTEVMVFSSILIFGAFATLVYKPLLVVYVAGCVAWLIYWNSSKPK